MTTADSDNRARLENIWSIYVCILALAGLQFVIAYQNIDSSQMFARMLVGRDRRGGAGASVLHALVDGEARASVVCCRSSPFL